MTPLSRGRLGLGLVGGSLLLVATTAALGESVATRSAGRAGPLPPYSLSLHPSPWLVVAFLVLATLAGACGLWLCLAAVARGWAPSPRRLLAAGLVATFALLLVPPTTSDDLYSYTAYGRMAVLGRDPYTTTPNDLRGDPVADQAGDPWRDQPTVYGPLATAEQSLAARVAGTSARTAAALLALANAVAFSAVGVLLFRSRRDDGGRRRVTLMWTLNPLLLMHLVAAAHVDALLVLCAVGAVLALRRSAFVAGLLGGAAAAVKLSGALVCAALAWQARPRDTAPVFAQSEQPAGRKPLLALVLGGVLVTPPAYLLAGGATALGPVRRAARFVSFGSPWRALSVPLEHYAGYSTSRAIVSTLSLAAVVAMAWLLARALPQPAAPPDAVARSAAVTSLAWLVAATYVLPWYDSWAWPFLALLPASRWDRWLLARTSVLTLAYLPGRTLPMPSPLPGLLSGLRMYFTPLALGLLACIAVAWARERTP